MTNFRWKCTRWLLQPIIPRHELWIVPCLFQWWGLELENTGTRLFMATWCGINDQSVYQGVPPKSSRSMVVPLSALEVYMKPFHRISMRRINQKKKCRADCDQSELLKRLDVNLRRQFFWSGIFFVCMSKNLVWKDIFIGELKFASVDKAFSPKCESNHEHSRLWHLTRNCTAKYWLSSKSSPKERIQSGQHALMQFAEQVAFSIVSWWYCSHY
jgi:hypothetical protein